MLKLLKRKLEVPQISYVPAFKTASIGRPKDIRSHWVSHKVTVFP